MFLQSSRNARGPAASGDCRRVRRRWRTPSPSSLLRGSVRRLFIPRIALAIRPRFRGEMVNHRKLSLERVGNLVNAATGNPPPASTLPRRFSIVCAISSLAKSRARGTNLADSEVNCVSFRPVSRIVLGSFLIGEECDLLAHLAGRRADPGEVCLVFSDPDRDPGVQVLGEQRRLYHARVAQPG